MKIQLLSDVHLEHRKDHRIEIQQTDADILVLAGDIGEGFLGIEWAADLSQNHAKPLIYVSGNHEYYDSDFIENLLRMERRASQLGIHFLEEDTIELNGYRFAGATLWTSFKDRSGVMDRAAAYRARRNMSDFHCVRLEGELLTPNRVSRMHESACQFLESYLSKEDAERTVVITHHAPSLTCRNRRFAEGPMTKAFCSHLDHLFGLSKVWCFGHTHFCFDELLDGTRVVSNPVGYPGEILGFDPGKVIEV